MKNMLIRVVIGLVFFTGAVVLFYVGMLAHTFLELSFAHYMYALYTSLAIFIAYIIGDATITSYNMRKGK